MDQILWNAPRIIYINVYNVYITLLFVKNHTTVDLLLILNLATCLISLLTMNSKLEPWASKRLGINARDRTVL